MTKAHHLATRKQHAIEKRTVPLNFLLQCSQDDLGNIELARLAEVADLRAQLLVIVDRMVDNLSQAALARWFKDNDRESLKRALETEESALEWAKRMVREGQRKPEELLPLPAMEPSTTHRAAAIRYQERNLAEGKCRFCPEPLDRNSVCFCTKHLAMDRQRRARKRGVRGEPGSVDYLYGEITESMHGRQLGSLAALAMNREKKTRAVLAELGIPPEIAAVSLKASIEALLKCMPTSEDDAMEAAELYELAIVSSPSTGQNAIKELFSTGQIERIGKGNRYSPYLYFKPTAPPEERPKRKALPKAKNAVLLQVLRGEEPGSEK